MPDLPLKQCLGEAEAPFSSFRSPSCLRHPAPCPKPYLRHSLYLSIVSSSPRYKASEISA